MKLGILDKEKSSNKQFSIYQASTHLLESKEILEEQDLYGVDALLMCKNDLLEMKDICNWIIKIKRGKCIPMWITTSEKQLEEKNVYLQLGACGIFERDYSIEEIYLSIRNSLTMIVPEAQTIMKKAPIFQLEPLKLSLTIEDVSIALTRLEFSLLEALYNNRNEVCTYEMLASDLLGEECAVFDEASQARVANIICKIRAKLAKIGEEKEELVRTVRSIGYMLILPE